jgi:predicted dehydrogenase
VDAVIITASTDSSEPVSQAAKMCRPRGRIVLVGVTGLELSRSDFYEKELTFQVSCSYGPGRYDPAYEEGGRDYPIGYVRWTEQRNFEAVLDLMADGSIDVEPLITHRFSLERAAEAYELLVSETPSLGILLDYGPEGPVHRPERYSRTVQLSPSGTGEAIRVAFLGAGNHAGRVLMPAFRKAGAGLHAVVSREGVSAESQGRRHGFTLASTDTAAAAADPAVQAVVVATRHDAHASQVLAALQAGKHVFCEKPLCLTLEELEQIAGESKQRSGQLLMVGFNRRFAPHIARMRDLLAPLGQPRVMVMTVNAGGVAPDHWTQDSAVGGGRILGEGCHFIDLLRHLAGSPIVTWHASSLGRHPAITAGSDNTTITLQFADGSLGTVHYLANGSRAFPKERLEVFCASRVLQLDNFRTLRGWGWPGFSRMRLWRQDKGHTACVRAFLDALRAGGPAPIPLDEILEVSRISIEAQQALR